MSDAGGVRRIQIALYFPNGDFEVLDTDLEFQVGDVIELENGSWAVKERSIEFKKAGPVTSTLLTLEVVPHGD